ncbi:unnamed protein product [Adineta steineri]|uniref:Uncharacterized protein n=1 Tax=Adineta steineri TaxID=433720 RepID=A0A819Q084_9BILA|nr:unnamed protein product [Adineta steineri]CAF4023676.1 unnamed protein product [Adineta steineri]
MTIREENVNKNKYQRNLEVFNQFPELTKHAIMNINNVIDRLLKFKYVVEEMKSNVLEMNRRQILLKDIHIQILKEGLSKVEMYKRRLNKRIDQNSRDAEEKT